MLRFELIFGLSRFSLAHQFGEPGLFSAPEITDLYRRPGLMTCKKLFSPDDAEMAFGGWERSFRAPYFAGRGDFYRGSSTHL